MIKVQSIENDSLAQAVGILPGDKILRINDQEVRDRLDFEFYRNDVALDFEVMRGEDILNLSIDRNSGKSLGIDPEVMKIHICKNNCVFCFVHQTPRGMRRTLYVKDEDYRYSFLDGHFTTLSNMTPERWQRVLDQRLSPIYISVHATEPELRARLLKNPKIEPILERLEWLRMHNIEFHTQIVVIPEWNDGPHLERSINELLPFYPHLRSISVVPVGLTAHRKNLPDLRKFTYDDAVQALEMSMKLGEEAQKTYGENLVFPSDELFVTAKRPFPPASFYGDFSQYENGVGTLRALIDDFEQELPTLPRSESSWEVTVLTAPLASEVQSQLLKRLEQEKGLTSELIVCENLTFGSPVTVTGLLCGKDMLSGLEKSRLKGPILIPPNSLNSENLFLDDLTPSDIEKQLGRTVIAPMRFRDYFPQ